MVKAIELADRVCGWLENLPSEEMPPRWMWTVDRELDNHWKWVEAERKKPAKDRHNDGTDDFDEDDDLRKQVGR